MSRTRQSEHGRIRLGQVLLTLTALALMLVALTVFRAPDEPLEASRSGTATPRVTVSEVGTQPFTLSVDVIGRVSPWREVSIAAEVGGRIETVAADIGDRVAAGEVLLTIDTADYEVALREAEAARLRAEARLEESAAALQRMDALRGRGAISEREYEAALATQRAGEADLSSAEAGLDRARDNLADTRVRAPFDGTIVERHVDPGALVAGDRALLELADLDTVAVEVGLTEREILLARRATAASVRSSNQPGLAGEGTIDGVGERADPATGTYIVRIRVDNNGEERLLGGMVVDVSIPYARLESVPTVTAAALLAPDTDPHVFVVREGRARRVDLAIVARQNDRIGVAARESAASMRRGRLAAGDGVLQTGDLVIVIGQSRLTDGSAVDVTGQR